MKNLVVVSVLTLIMAHNVRAVDYTEKNETIVECQTSYLEGLKVVKVPRSKDGKLFEYYLQLGMYEEIEWLNEGLINPNTVELENKKINDTIELIPKKGVLTRHKLFIEDSQGTYTGIGEPILLTGCEWKNIQ